MGIVLSAFALLAASVACGLSLAVALRVKKLLDPLTEEGVMSRRREEGPREGAVVPRTPTLIDADGMEVDLPFAGPDPWVLTFQAVGCSGCKLQLPAYKKFLRDTGVDRDRVFSVIVGDVEGVSFYNDELGELGRVVHASGDAFKLVQGLGVSVFPTYLVVDGGGKVMVSSQSSSLLADVGVASLTPALVGG
ncbi:hypothetical protein F7R91_11290 [Streptomyces luteolifulvus]|uniref:Thioredoxin domain-containing protein n=1 Tax=Streptomyces luteolifulvus TaxID=2615112 RepID=A0A6H9V341_9ACTN|nr:hypothetical protein [Streptomyces luteolifulvus]KAB1147668.1 hypothetical protein F7R91_11290 [Streptomyces luteolifulvus]